MSNLKKIDPKNGIEIVKIKDIAPSDFELPKLDQLENKEVYITGFMLDMSQYGEYAVINTLGQGAFITTGQVIIKQLKRAQKRLIEQGKTLNEKTVLQGTVKAIEVKDGKYYILE